MHRKLSLPLRDDYLFCRIMVIPESSCGKPVASNAKAQLQAVAQYRLTCLHCTSISIGDQPQCFLDLALVSCSDSLDGAVNRSGGRLATEDR
jgi:hypothetical protein